VYDIQDSYPYSDVGAGPHTLIRRYNQTCKADKAIVIESNRKFFSRIPVTLKQCLFLIHYSSQ
jgi:hypothetical protein